MIRFSAIVFAFILYASDASAAVKVQEVRTDNGQTAWLIEDHTLPVVTLRINIARSGSAYDPAGKGGLSTFAVSMMDEGAGDMDSLAFNHALEEHAVRFGASASEDSTTISMQALSEFKDKAFDLLAASLTRPRFDGEAVERIRSGLISELQQVNESPLYLASLKWKEMAFPGHSYRHPRLGTAESISLIKREDLLQFHKNVFLCNAKTVSVVGDIKPEEVRTVLPKLFPSSSECKTVVAAITDIKITDGNGIPVLVEKAVPQTVVQASLPAVTRSDPHYYAMVVLNDILGGSSLTARLGKEIRDKRGLAYYAESDVEELEHAAFISVHFATRSEHAKEAVDVFLKELDKIRGQGVTQAELDDSKRYLTGSFPLSLDSQNSLSEYLIMMQHYNLGIDYLDRRNALINAVTLNEVNHLAKSLFSHAPLIVMAGERQEKDKK